MGRVGDISLFLQVLDLGSISAAARHMDLSVAVASQRLKRLERDLGVRLLHRTTRRLHPTPEGLALAREGRVLVEELALLGERLRERGGDVAGTLRVTAPASFGRQYIAPLMAGFLSAHPRLQVSLDLDDRVVDLVGAGYDLAIRIGRLDDSSLVSRQIAANEQVLCASPDYLRRRGEPQQPGDLAGHDCLLLTGRDGRRDVWHLTATDGTRMEVRVRGRFESNYGAVVREAAVAGLGIALHSVWHVYRDLAEGRLQVVLPGYPPPPSGIHAVMPGRVLVPHRVRAFTDHLAMHLSDLPWARPGHREPPPARQDPGQLQASR